MLFYKFPLKGIGNPYIPKASGSEGSGKSARIDWKGYLNRIRFGISHLSFLVGQAHEEARGRHLEMWARSQDPDLEQLADFLATAGSTTGTRNSQPKYKTPETDPRVKHLRALEKQRPQTKE